MANIYIFFSNNYWHLSQKNIQCIWKENFIHIKNVDNTYFDKVFSPCLFIEHFLESALVFYLRLNLHKARITRIVKAYAKTCSNLQTPLSSIFTEHSHHSFLIFIKKERTLLGVNHANIIYKVQLIVNDFLTIFYFLYKVFIYNRLHYFL